MLVASVRNDVVNDERSSAWPSLLNSACCCALVVAAYLLDPQKAHGSACEGGHALRQSKPLQQRDQRQRHQAAQSTFQIHLSAATTAIHDTQHGDTDGQAGGVELWLMSNQPREHSGPQARVLFWHTFGLEDSAHLNQRVVNHSVKFVLDAGTPAVPRRLRRGIGIPGVHVVKAGRQDDQVLGQRLSLGSLCLASGKGRIDEAPLALVGGVLGIERVPVARDQQVVEARRQPVIHLSAVKAAGAATKRGEAPALFFCRFVQLLPGLPLHGALLSSRQSGNDCTRYAVRLPGGGLDPPGGTALHAGHFVEDALHNRFAAARGALAQPLGAQRLFSNLVRPLPIRVTNDQLERVRDHQRFARGLPYPPGFGRLGVAVTSARLSTQPLKASAAIPFIKFADEPRLELGAHLVAVLHFESSPTVVPAMSPQPARSAARARIPESIDLSPVGVPLLQGLALARHDVRLDVDLHVVTHGVVDQQFTHQVVDAKVSPAGAGQLAQVVAGPLALAHRGEHRAGLRLTHRQAAPPREQELAVITLVALDLAIGQQQETHLVGQRQAMFDTGLCMLGRDEPLPLRQADVVPARLPGLAQPGAVAQHQQGQHAVLRVVGQSAHHAAHQVLEVHATQPRGLDRDLGLREVAEADAGHGVGADQSELVGLPEGQREELEHQAHVVDGQRLLQRPHQLAVESRLVDLGQRHFTKTRQQVQLDHRRRRALALDRQVAVAGHPIGEPGQQLAGQHPARQT
ncbi:hypothetical protein WR25_27098 [Diploscapter pachys]|uniref:Uncharacterized protein n=1 Tax=Diploscapter pachys TaxID=2018661 RepID=A0A2A2KK81_9BILA|nr:hypothetical protein WR25_27098 [Diploscapter pachys]